MDRQIFLIQLDRLGIASGVPANDAQRDLYWMELQCLPNEIFISGIDRLVGSHIYKTFPTLGDVVEACCGGEEKPSGYGSTWGGVRSKEMMKINAGKRLLEYRREQKRLELENDKQILRAIAVGEKPRPRKKPKPSSVLRGARERIKQLEAEVVRQGHMIFDLRRQLSEKDRRQRIDAKREELRKQAEALGIDTSSLTKEG